MDQDSPLFVISVAAELAGMHPQTLRQYDRLGLVTPRRTRGRGRRYTARDIDQLREVQRLSQDEGVNLAGIKRILELENQVEALQRRLSELKADLDRAEAVAQTARRVFAAGPGGEIITMAPGRRPSRSTTSALVVWRPSPR